MNNLLLLLVCFFAGVLLRQLKRMPPATPAVLNSFIIHVSLPAITLLYIHDLRPTGQILAMVAMPWIHFGLAAGFFWLLGTWLKLPRNTTGALILTAGLGNTSFVGLPMIEAFYGQAGLIHGIVIDQFGSFMVLSTLGITVAGFYSDGRPSLAVMAKRIFSFPPFIFLILALLLTPIYYPDWLVVLLKRLGDTLAPLALLSVGFQLYPDHLAGNVRHLIYGLGFKLLFLPGIIMVIYTYLFNLDGLPLQVTLFEAAMPPMITAGIIASEHGIDPPLANLMVAVGIMLSLFTLSAWWQIFERL